MTFNVKNIKEINVFSNNQQKERGILVGIGATDESLLASFKESMQSSEVVFVQHPTLNKVEKMLMLLPQQVFVVSDTPELSPEYRILAKKYNKNIVMTFPLSSRFHELEGSMYMFSKWSIETEAATLVALTGKGKYVCKHRFMDKKENDWKKILMV